MTNHPNRSRARWTEADPSTLETVKSYVARLVGNSDHALTLADAIKEADAADDERLLGFEIDAQSVSKYLRDSGEYERCTFSAGERDHIHLAVVVACVDLGGHYGVDRRAVAYFEWADRAKAATLVKRLNSEAA